MTEELQNFIYVYISTMCMQANKQNEQEKTQSNNSPFEI